MFRSIFRTKPFSFYLVATLVPAAVSAAPVTLRYDFTAVVGSTSYFHECYLNFPTCADYEASGRATAYQGPELGTWGTGRIDVSFDPDDDAVPQDYTFATDLPVLFAPGPRWVSSYDPVTRAVSLTGFNDSDLLEISFYPEFGGGSAYFNWEQDGTGADFAEVELLLFGVTVTDLTEIAPVPLPAALPLLGAGVAAFGLLARRRRRAVASAG